MNQLKTLMILVVGIALLALPSAAQDFDCWDENLWEYGYDEDCDVEEPENENVPDDTDTGSADDPNDPGDFTADPSSNDDYDELDEEELSELIQTYQPPSPTQDLPPHRFRRRHR